jgi:hypothetical protein
MIQIVVLFSILSAGAQTSTPQSEAKINEAFACAKEKHPNLGKEIPNLRTTCKEKGEKAYIYQGATNNSDKNFSDLSKLYFKIENRLDPVSAYAYTGTCDIREIFLLQALNPKNLTKNEKILGKEEYKSFRDQLTETQKQNIAGLTLLTGGAVIYLQPLTKEMFATHQRSKVFDLLHNYHREKTILNQLNPAIIEGNALLLSEHTSKRIQSFLSNFPELKAIYVEYVAAKNPLQKGLLARKFKNTLAQTLTTLKPHQVVSLFKEARQVAFKNLSHWESQLKNINIKGGVIVGTALLMAGAATLYFPQSAEESEKINLPTNTTQARKEILQAAFLAPAEFCGFSRLYPTRTKAALEQYETGKN